MYSAASRASARWYFGRRTSTVPAATPASAAADSTIASAGGRTAVSTRPISTSAYGTEMIRLRATRKLVSGLRE